MNLSNSKALCFSAILGLILAACGGSPQPSITSVTVKPATASVEVGKTVTLSSEVVALNGAVTTVIWTSSDPTKATVNAGVVTGVAAGSVTITATSTADSSKKGTSTVSITAPAPTITGVAVSPDSANLIIGGNTTLTATVSGTGSFNNAVTWSSSDDSRATVSSNGLVSALAVGTVTITATSVADTSKIGTATITIAAPAPTITSVSVSPASTNLIVGGSTTLTATVSGTGSFDNAVIWSSSDTAKATVSSGGLVNALAEGTLTITATSVADSSKTGTATITIAPAPPTITGVAVSPATKTLAPNATQQFSATVSGTGAFNPSVTWSSSNTAVATVDSTGLVTAKTQGTSTITATSVGDSSKSGNATLTVPALLVFSNYTNLVATANTAIPTRNATVVGGSTPYTFSAITLLPTGLTLDTSTGAISGTPASPSAASNYTIQVKDANDFTATAAINIAVNAALVLSYSQTRALTEARPIVAANFSRTLSGGTAPFTYSVEPGDLPTGISLAASGELSGTTSDTGDFPITITVTDANGASAEASFTLVVNPPVSLDYAGSPYQVSDTAPNNTPVATPTREDGTATFTYSVESQSFTPVGPVTGNPSFNNQFNFNTATGEITTKNAPHEGTYSITIRVTDANGSTATATVDIEVIHEVVQ